MAERRMVSASVIDDDDFIELSPESRTLYFYLLLSADDDGFVRRPLATIRLTGLDMKDLQPLIDKGYLFKFPSGVIVITHWRVHNRIRKDTYTPTKFTEELSHLRINESLAYEYCETPVKENFSRIYSAEEHQESDTDCMDDAEYPVMFNGSRTARADIQNSSISERDEEYHEYITEESHKRDGCVTEKPEVRDWYGTESPDVRDGDVAGSLMQNRIGKYSINSKEKVSPVKDRELPDGNVTDGFKYFWSLYPHKVGMRSAQKAYEEVIACGVNASDLINALKKQLKSWQWTKENGRFIPNPTNWLEQGRWEDEYTEPSPEDSDNDYDDEIDSFYSPSPEELDAAIQRTLTDNWRDD